MSVDERLLARENTSKSSTEENGSDSSNGSTDRKAQLNLAKRESSGGEKNYNQKASSLREAVHSEKNRKKSIKKKLSTKLNALSITTAKLLKGAWMNLLVSFGTTIFWIDIHVFGRQVLGKKMFCAPGEEWTMKAGSKKKDSKMLKLIEPMGIACCNFGCLLIIIAIFTLFSLIASVFSSDIFGTIWSMIKESLSGLVSVIAG